MASERQNHRRPHVCGLDEGRLGRGGAPQLRGRSKCSRQECGPGQGGVGPVDICREGQIPSHHCPQVSPQPESHPSLQEGRDCRELGLSPTESRNDGGQLPDLHLKGWLQRASVLKTAGWAMQATGSCRAAHYTGQHPLPPSCAVWPLASWLPGQQLLETSSRRRAKGIVSPGPHRVHSRSRRPGCLAGRGRKSSRISGEPKLTSSRGVESWLQAGRPWGPANNHQLPGWALTLTGHSGRVLLQ